MKKSVYILTMVLAAVTIALTVSCRRATNTTKTRENQLPFTYQNPIPFSYTYFNGTQEREITELRDPCIMREGDTYYLVFTHYPFTHHTSRNPERPDLNSSPGIRLYSSKNLKTWRFENWIVKSGELPDDCPYKHRFWAPELRKMNGRFYIIFYADNWIKDEYNCRGEMGYVGFVGVADKPEGPYEHITWLEGSGCDTHLFGDNDGQVYSVMPFSNTYIQKTELNGIGQGNIFMTGERKQIVARDNSDIGLTFSPDYMEAPWMINRNGKYVLFTGSPYKANQRPENDNSNLKTGYWVGVAMADNVWGPYTKQPQVFLGGHIAVFTGPDGKEWFSYRGESGGVAQGKLCIDPVPFKADGTLDPWEPTTTPVTIE